jgi:phage/conjugal plasmid C-4 type zinc finger TraR family protein
MMHTGERTRERAMETVERQTEAAIAAVRARLSAGPGAAECDDCGAEIPAARRASVPGTTTCVDCQADRERRR